MKNRIKNNAGFIEIILIIIVALLIMKFAGVTISGVWDWFVSLFRSVFR